MSNFDNIQYYERAICARFDGKMITGETFNKIKQVDSFKQAVNCYDREVQSWIAAGFPEHQADKHTPWSPNTYRINLQTTWLTVTVVE